MHALQELPGSAVRIRLDRSSRLNDAIDPGTLDLAMYIGDTDDTDAVTVGASPSPATLEAQGRPGEPHARGEQFGEEDRVRAEDPPCRAWLTVTATV